MAAYAFTPFGQGARAALKQGVRFLCAEVYKGVAVLVRRGFPTRFTRFSRASRGRLTRAGLAHSARATLHALRGRCYASNSARLAWTLLRTATFISGFTYVFLRK